MVFKLTNKASSYLASDDFFFPKKGTALGLFFIGLSGRYLSILCETAGLHAGFWLPGFLPVSVDWAMVIRGSQPVGLWP
jgi:hypothetical protein